MQLEDYFDFSEPEAIRIQGHRVWIEDVLYEHIHNAMTPDELAVRFPTLTLEQIYATILYYLHNKEQVTDYLAAWLEHGRLMREQQRLNPSPVELRLRRIKAEREAAKRQARELEPA